MVLLRDSTENGFMHAVESPLLEHCNEMSSRHPLLAERLRTAARLLLEEGVLPLNGLVDDLCDYRNQYQSLAAAAELEADRPLAEIHGEITAAHRRDSAIAVLERCLLIKSSNGLLELEAYHGQVRDVQSHIATRQAESSELIELIEAGKHPALRLLSLVTAPESFSDDEWENTLDMIRTEFHPRLAVAIARGRLSVRDMADDGTAFHPDERPET